jgi:hypothetical protein
LSYYNSVWFKIVRFVLFFESQGLGGMVFNAIISNISVISW